MKKIVKCIFNKLLKMKWDENRIIQLSQFIKFGIVGISNTVVAYVTYAIMVILGSNYLVANISGFCISVINAYYWNNKYVFKQINNEKRNVLNIFLKTFMSYAGTGLVLNNVLLIMWINCFQINKMIAPIINLIVTIPINFLLNKFWAFKNK